MLDPLRAVQRALLVEASTWRAVSDGAAVSKVQVMMRTGLLAALLLTCMALLWVQSGQATRGRAIVRAPTGHLVPPPAAPLPHPQQPAPAAQAPVPPGTGAEADLAQWIATAMHTIEASQACLAGTSASVKSARIAVHRWVDAAGIVHFSDQQPPVGTIRNYRRIEVDGVPPIQVHASGYDVNLPDQLAQRAIADTQAIARVLHDTLQVAGDPGLVLTIEFMGTAASYARRVGNPTMAASDGTYSSADRTIRIRLQDDVESNFRILRHEIAHALIHEQVGHLPTTLNEGLAAYFERVEVSGLGAQVDLTGSVHAMPSAAISEDGQEELVDLLARDGALFYAPGREQRYLRSFALVAVLMGTPEKRRTLGALLNAQRESPCIAIDTARLLDENYPGGLNALAVDWSRWLRDPPESVQAF